MFEKYSFKNNPLFYNGLYRLAIPMALTSLMGALLNLADNFMIQLLGNEESVAAVGIGTQIFFLLVVTLYGVYSGFGVFISQYWGKKDMKHLQTMFMTAIVTGIFLSIIVFTLSFIFPQVIIGLYSHDAPKVIKLAVPYLRITSISFIVSAIIFSFEMALRSTENVKIPMFVSLIGVVTNIVLDYLLIFGHFGFPKLGVTGAAYATTIARFLQLFIYLIYIYVSKNPVLFIKIKNFIFDLKLLKKAYAKSLPVMGNEFFWSLGITTIFAAYGLKGTTALSSMTLFNTIVSLLTVFTMGIANSSAIMISKKIGEKEYNEAKWYAKLFLFNSVRFGILTSVLFIAAIPLIPIFYSNQSAVIVKNIEYCMVVYALYMPFNLLAATFIVGILRSGGDTKVAFFLETVTLWGYAIPMVFILVIFTSLPVYIVYLIITFELVLKDIMCYFRYKSGKYMHNLIH